MLCLYCLLPFTLFHSIAGDTTENSINFAIPSSSVLQRESDKFKIHVSSPGLIDDSLKTFASAKQGKDVKISVDGKKIAYGFGKSLGEEDLGGFEEAPTLPERKAKHEDEMKLVDEVQNRIKEVSIQNLPASVNREQLKSDLKNVIKTMSEGIKSLRFLAVKKKRYVEQLLKRVNGPWRQSKLANAISFIQTQIIKIELCVTNLLECIDGIGFYITVLNGSSKHYRYGRDIEIDLIKQANYVCLPATAVDARENPEVKQRSQEWHRLRSGARVTGSTLFKTLGLGTLKDQKAHFDSVFRDIKEEISPELQVRYDYGTSNEITAVATLVGKILPVYYPELIYREDGCVVLPMDSEKAYAVISGDGTGFTCDNRNQVAFELKCPIPGKQYVPDVYYELPVYYTTQVLSQMAAKDYSSFANLCYTPQSSTLIHDTNDTGLWENIWKYTNELYGTDIEHKKNNKESS